MNFDINILLFSSIDHLIKFSATIGPIPSISINISLRFSKFLILLLSSSKLFIFSDINSAISDPTPSIPKEVNNRLKFLFLEFSILNKSLLMLLSPNPSIWFNSFI